MRPRDKTGGKALKTQRPRTLKRRDAPSSVAADEAPDVARLTRERDEALEQLAASAEILKVISHSTFDLQTVFDTIAVNAVRLCAAHMGAVHRFDGELVHIVAHHNFPPEAVEVLRRMYPRPPQLDQASGRAILTREVAEIETGTTRAKSRWLASGGAFSRCQCSAMALLSEHSSLPGMKSVVSPTGTSNC